MIITNNEAALRVFCEPVLPEEVGELVATLERELDYANRLGKSGIGLAAPQIGIAKNIAIIRLPKLSLDLVNAKLEKGFDPALFTDEGCLSFPGRSENTTRYQEVYVTNNLVEPHSLVASGFVAVVCQHELDHLNSVLFMDRKQPKLVPVVKQAKVGPNDFCPCSSGKKYKKCGWLGLCQQNVTLSLPKGK
jgi:peptide deformylase